MSQDYLRIIYFLRLLCGLAFLDGKLDQSADAIRIKGLERIEVQEVLVQVGSDVGGVVVTGEAEGELGEVVGPVGEVGSESADLGSGQGCAGSLDHGADDVLELVVVLSNLIIDKAYLRALH